MKTTTFLLLTFFVSFGVIAQNIYNLEFFTEEAPPFILSINGVQQHEEPTTNIRIEGFIQPLLKLKVEFTDNGEVITKNLYMPEQSSEISYQIKNTKRGYKVRAFSFVPLPQAPPLVYRPDVIVVPYATVSGITQTTTTTTTNGGHTGMNVGVNGDGVNVSVNIGGNGTVYQETTTTTTTSTTGATNAYVMDGYNGNIGCPWPLSQGDFEEAKATIAAKDFDDTRLGLAKQIIRSNCLFADQVRDLVRLMTYDDTQLELAKFAYGYTYDIGNYFKVSQAFEYESSVEELNEYIENYRW